MSAAHPSTDTPGRRRWLTFLPLAAFCCLAALFFVRLSAGDPSRLPSALIGHAVPAFVSPPVSGLDKPGFGSADLTAGHVTLVNVFASWCVECHDEHDALMRLSEDPTLRARGVSLAGLAYKDKAEDTRRYLGAKGDPYRVVGDDASGRTGIDFGVYGVPETFVVRGNGTIAFKLVGGITDGNIDTLRAEIDKAAR